MLGKRAGGVALLWVLSFGVAAYALLTYAFLPMGSAVAPGMRDGFVAHAEGVYVHAFAAAIALLLGPVQFSTKLRREHVRVHRWSGRIYLAVGVLAGGLSGLYLVQYAYGGPLAKAGFGTLAVLWLYTGWRAFDAIRSGAVAAHRRWMVRNFSLTFAAVTLRIYLPLGALAGVQFEQLYPVVAWLAWVPNLLLAERVWNRSPRPTV